MCIQWVFGVMKGDDIFDLFLLVITLRLTLFLVTFTLLLQDCLQQRHRNKTLKNVKKFGLYKRLQCFPQLLQDVYGIQRTWWWIRNGNELFRESVQLASNDGNLVSNVITDDETRLFKVITRSDKFRLSGKLYHSPHSRKQVQTSESKQWQPFSFNSL